MRKWGAWIKEEAEKELAEFYPKDPDGATPIAYLWARTIGARGRGVGREVPLMRSLWLAKKANKKSAAFGRDRTKKTRRQSASIWNHQRRQGAKERSAKGRSNAVGDVSVLRLHDSSSQRPEPISGQSQWRSRR